MREKTGTQDSFLAECWGYVSPSQKGTHGAAGDANPTVPTVPIPSPKPLGTPKPTVGAGLGLRPQESAGGRYRRLFGDCDPFGLRASVKPWEFCRLDVPGRERKRIVERQRIEWERELRDIGIDPEDLN